MGGMRLAATWVGEVYSAVECKVLGAKYKVQSAKCKVQSAEYEVQSVKCTWISKVYRVGGLEGLISVSRLVGTKSGSTCLIQIFVK